MPAALARPRWSIRLGAVFGVPIYVHASLFALLAWVALTQRPAGMHAVVGATLGLVVVFAVVLLHELGHVFVARAFDVRTRDVTLLPFGGVSRLERIPDAPWKELLVALAGPAVNLALAGLCALASMIFSSFASTGERLVMLNLALGLFNLVPASPLDGGRALRAALAMRLDRARATEIAAGLGLSVAVLLGGLGLMFQPMLVFVALLVGMGASNEIARARLERDLAGARVRDVMITDFDVLSPRSTLREAAMRSASGFQHELPVVEGGVVAGILTEDDLHVGLRARGPDTSVVEVMHHGCTTASPDEPLVPAFERTTDDANLLVVVVEGRLVGLVTAASLEERVRLAEATRRPPPAPHARGVRHG